jgi:hypothetical protein
VRGKILTGGIFHMRFREIGGIILQIKLDLGEDFYTGGVKNISRGICYNQTHYFQVILVYPILTVACGNNFLEIINSRNITKRLEIFRISNQEIIGEAGNGVVTVVERGRATIF